MDMPLTNKVYKNLIAIIGTIIALIAAIAAIGGNMLTGILASSCPPSGVLWLCVIWRYVLFIVLVVGGVLIFVFSIPIAVDLIVVFSKWLKRVIQNYINKPFDVFCKIYQQGHDVFIEVKNKEWFIDAWPIYLKSDFMYKGEVIQIPLKWDGISDTGEALIQRCKKRISHFATIDDSKKEYCLHLSTGRELIFPFLNNRTLGFQIAGYTSASTTKPFKHIIVHGLVIIESVKKEKVTFKIGTQW